MPVSIPHPLIVESDKVSPELSFFQDEQPQLPHPFLLGFVLQSLAQLCCPSLDSLQPLSVLPELDTELKEWPHQYRGKFTYYIMYQLSDIHKPLQAGWEATAAPDQGFPATV